MNTNFRVDQEKWSLLAPFEKINLYTRISGLNNTRGVALDLDIPAADLEDILYGIVPIPAHAEVKMRDVCVECSESLSIMTADLADMHNGVSIDASMESYRTALVSNVRLKCYNSVHAIADKLSEYVVNAFKNMSVVITHRSVYNTFPALLALDFQFPGIIDEAHTLTVDVTHQEGNTTAFTLHLKHTVAGKVQLDKIMNACDTAVVSLVKDLRKILRAHHVRTIIKQPKPATGRTKQPRSNGRVSALRNESSSAEGQHT